MNFKRIMIAAPKSGSGKTVITCALLQVLKDMGQKVISFKCGPDYIDPMFHQKAINIPSKNLDTFFTGEENTKAIFLKGRTESDFTVLEGVMGLFDGLGGIREEGSSYHLAKVTRTPIILVVDAKGMGRSVIPMLAGFLAYDREKLIKGVILNRMSKAYYDILKPLIEKELAISVIGFLPEQKELAVESRHLGLIMPEELKNIRENLKTAACALQKTISVDAIVHIAEAAEELPVPDHTPSRHSQFQTEIQFTDSQNFPVIAVARDAAFCFYYEDNLRLLQEYGAKLAFFSPLKETRLPTSCSGLLIGGGYPELYAGELSENAAMRKAVKNAFDNGMPVVAECGGFLYLHSQIEDQNGKMYPMSGVLPSICRNTGKLVRFGYIELTEKECHFLPKGEQIKGHEFHYFDSDNNGNDCLAVKPVTGKSYPCVISGSDYWLGFPHLYYPSNPAFAKNFVEKAKQWKACRITVRKRLI